MTMTHSKPIISLNTLRGLLPYRPGRPLMQQDWDFRECLEQRMIDLKAGDLLIVAAGRGSGEPVQYTGSWTHEPADNDCVQHIKIAVEDVAGCCRKLCAAHLRRPRSPLLATIGYYAQRGFYAIKR